MSETAIFTGTGHDSWPNLDSDAKLVLNVAEWDDAVLESKLEQYGKFVYRPELMPRAKKTAEYILDRLIFDQAYRDGVYALFIEELENELCGDDE